MWTNRLREDNQTVFAVLNTYRYHEHVGPDRDITQRPEDTRDGLNADWEKGKSRDIEVVAELQAEIDEAFKFAKEAPFP